MSDESCDVSGEVEDIVIGDVARSVAGCVATHVWDDDFVACLG